MRSDRAPVKSGLIRNNKGGYTWKNHKYIDKVKTKTGKIRYIYEDNDGELVDVTADELQKIVRDEEDKNGKNTGMTKYNMNLKQPLLTLVLLYEGAVRHI